MLSFSDLLNGLDHHFGLPLLLPFVSVVFSPSGSWGCIPFFLCAWVAFWGCSFWCLFFFRGCSFSFLWRGRWCLFLLWWGWCVVFLCCCCCWGWCLFFLCSCCWCFCWCCSFGSPLSSCGGAGGWDGGSPWGFFFFGVGGLDGDILMVFGSGQRSAIASASYVSHHDCHVHLSNSSYALLLAENTWQLGMNSDQSSSSSSCSPCWLGLH